MTEDELLGRVIEICKKHKVLYFHSTDSRRDLGKGFPDLVMAGSSHVIFAELKSDGGSTSAEQSVWKWRLLASGQRYYLWRPKDLPEIPKIIADLHDPIPEEPCAA